MGIYTKEEQFELIKDDWNNLEKIDNQYEEVCLEAIKQNGLALQYVKEQTQELCLEAVKQDGIALKYVEEQNNELCLTAVKQNGHAVRYVKYQTHEICLEAVKENGIALEYIEEQNDELCLTAVKQTGAAFYHIKNVKDITSEVYFYAFLQNYYLLNRQATQNAVEEFIKSKHKIEDNTFCIDIRQYFNKDYINCEINSFEYIKDFLLKENENNTYVFDDEYFVDEEYLGLLKEFALSNNNLIIIDNGNIRDIHKMLANKITTIDELKKGSF